MISGNHGTFTIIYSKTEEANQREILCATESLTLAQVLIGTSEESKAIEGLPLTPGCYTIWYQDKCVGGRRVVR